MNIFRNNIKLLMDKYNVEINDLAYAVKLDYERLNAYLLGDDDKIGNTQRAAIAEFFNLSYNYLMGCDVKDNDVHLTFFDYDRTLFAHNYDKAFIDCVTYEETARYLLVRGDSTFKNDKPIQAVRDYAKECYNAGEELFCLTHQVCSLRDAYNIKALSEHYGDIPMTYLSVNTAEHKIDMIRAMAYHRCALLCNCKLIDDRVSTVEMAISEGIVGINTSSLCADWEERHR